MLFSNIIDSWEDWERVFQDGQAFTPLAMEICRRHQLPQCPLQPLSPGTNAVFLAGEVVLKIFLPPEAGFDSTADFLSEQRIGAFAARKGLSCPTIRAGGTLFDRYRFHYLVFDYLSYPMVGDCFSTLSRGQKHAFAEAMNALCDRLHQPPDMPELIPPIDLIERSRRNTDWNRLPSRLKDQLLALLPDRDIRHAVVVHGDLNAKNVLLQPDGTPVWIDFADSILAPADYELPPLAFDLYRGDLACIAVLRRGEPLRPFVHRLLCATALHDFGADLIRGHLQRHGIPLHTIPDLAHLTHCLEEQWHDTN